ncbi:MAG: hypothetical protein ACRECV_21720 [Xanthobacteraceae bacterium]
MSQFRTSHHCAAFDFDPEPQKRGKKALENVAGPGFFHPTGEQILHAVARAEFHLRRVGIAFHPLSGGVDGPDILPIPAQRWPHCWQQNGKSILRRRQMMLW